MTEPTTYCPRCAGFERAFQAVEANLLRESELHQKSLARIVELEATIHGMKTALGALHILIRAGEVALDIPPGKTTE